MDWQNLPGGGNIEDRRGGGGIPGGGIAVGGVGGLIIALIAMFFGVDPGAILGGQGSAPTQTQTQTAPGQQDTSYQFVDRILASTDQVWSGIFAQAGRTYTKPTLVLYSGATPTACGQGSAAAGPFYCPLDNKVYLDTSFFAQMDRRLGGGGDFAYSYVIAHEVGHHVQNELGIADQVTRAQQQARSEAEANRYSVALELQADCFAGVWGNKVSSLANLTEADVREAINTATAIGDDTLQRQGQGYVVPDSFTHGTSQQRVNWFMTGFRSGDPNKCDTFNGQL
ncbi:KPN_02809 family neutral zinc metallopeptidase [Deinococcus apachensis]|uniref:KPN_02809 family neutral zinc metallopeptidase n=1 Tax=Deinococcus apachensis TaxID=309886 RepID=UPI00039FF872|nr:neutral zinc metallopeptidase [Deinococcus apachensis]